MSDAAASASTVWAKLKDVDGFLRRREAWWLHEAARVTCMRAGHATVVEIGSWKGRSTIALALGISASGRGGRLYAIDHHRGSSEHIAKYGEVDTYADFCTNIARAGVSEVVIAVRQESASAVGLFENESVDMIFIDGSHEYTAVLADLDAWRPKLTTGATVALNDPLWPGVNRSIRDRIAKPRAPFSGPRYIDNTLFLTYSPGLNRSYVRGAAQALRLQLFLLGLRISRRFRTRLPKQLEPAARFILNRVLISGRAPSKAS